MTRLFDEFMSDGGSHACREILDAVRAKENLPSSCTAASTVRARPSITGSPLPVTPSSVSIFSSIQRGGTR